MISLASRIGSPAENGERAIEPASWLIASGWSLLRMKFAPAAAAGQVCQRNSLPEMVLPEADVVRGDQHINGFERCDRRLHDCAAAVRTPGQQGGDAAGGERDEQNNDTRGFHTLHFPHDAATDIRRHFDTMPPPDRWFAHSGFQQVNVKAWLMSGI